MTVSRREVLGLGVASASTLLWALGCSGPTQALRRAPQVSGEVRAWLREAVARLVAVFPTVHALAVSRRRTAAAFDVLGPGIARLRADGLILTVRTPDGWREHVTTDLSEAGVSAAATALGAPRQRKSLDFGAAAPTPDEPPHLDDRDLRQRVELLLADSTPSSRIVYAAGLLDIDDAITWSIAPGRDLEQRLIRIRHAATRAASNETRPTIHTIEHAWSGWLDDQPLTPADLAATTATALELMTPGAFLDGERTLVLDPTVAALLIDTAVRTLLTATPHNPAIARRAAADAPLASPLLSLVDDPTIPTAYGAFTFDDEGERATPITLLDAGRITSRLRSHADGGSGRGRRPGHLAPVAPAPSHLVIAPGPRPTPQLYTDGLILEGGLSASYNPATDRIRISCARARELKAGNTTGRLHADIDLLGSLTTLLTSIDAISSTPTTIALPDPSHRLHRWSSISTPALRTRGLVRARR